MYALPGGVVVKRRRSVTVPVVLTLVGAAMIVLNGRYGADLTNNLRSALVFVGGALALTGIILLAVRVFGSDGVPFHRGEKCYLHYEELYFERGSRHEVEECIGGGCVDRLLQMRRSSVPAVAVALYRTPGNRFAAMQAFEYSELEYRPLTDLRIVGR